MATDPSTEVDLTAGFKQTLFTRAAAAAPAVTILGELLGVGKGPLPTAAGFFSSWCRSDFTRHSAQSRLFRP